MEHEIKSDMGEVSLRRYFDKQSISWHDKIKSGDPERIYEILSDKAKGIKGPVLDAGCGTGILLPILSNLNVNISPVFEVDISYFMLLKNREYHEAITANYTQADVAYLPFRTDYFQTILSFASFAHFSPKENVLEEFWRVLRPGGLFVILHLMGSEDLNMMHERVGDSVKNDRLPPIDNLSLEAENKNFKILNSEDSENIYLLTAQK